MTVLGSGKSCMTLAAMTAGLLALPSPVRAQPSPSDAGVVSREIQMLQLIGGEPLTPAERQQAARIDEVALRADPQAWAKDDANSALVLRRVAAHDTILEATVVESSRLNAEQGRASVPALQPVMDMERAIIRAHDPTIALAGPNLVTEASLRALAQAAAWTDLHGKLPPGPADLAAVERDTIRRNYASYPAELQTAYAHIGRNFATSAAFMATVKPAQVVPFLQGHLAGEPRTVQAGPGAAVALLMQDLYNETVRRNWKPPGAASDPVTAMRTMMMMHLMQRQFDGLRTAFGRCSSSC